MRPISYEKPYFKLFAKINDTISFLEQLQHQDTFPANLSVRIQRQIEQLESVQQEVEEMILAQ